MSHALVALVSTIVLIPLVACDAQVDSEHQGNPLASLTGVLTTASSDSSATSEVSVVWGVQAGGLSLVGADSVAVTGSFPAQFQLDIYETPTDDMLDERDGIAFGVAYIIVDWDGTSGLGTGWYGADLAHVLVYLTASPAADSSLGLMLRGSPSPGYHLYDAHRLTEAERQARNACISDLFNENPDHMPTAQESFAACGGDRDVDLFPADDDLATTLEIELGTVIDINDLPHSW